MRNEVESVFSAGCTALEKGDGRRAFKLFSQAVAADYTGALHNLAYCYDEGVGVRKNFGKARYWYVKAWKHGSIASASNLALLYAARGNSRQAMAWWQKAVQRGDGDAALDLAKFYLKKGGRASTKTAKGLLRKAARSRYISPAGREEASVLIDELKQ